jgi:tRNA U34 5-methylaminomethyl-2-thiouridine-forming methyltransferase MnmC
MRDQKMSKTETKQEHKNQEQSPEIKQAMKKMGGGIVPIRECTIIIGDAAQTLGPWPGRADAWFLDGFSPARNPELWTDTLMAQVAAHTNAGGTFATYTAAGSVRRALALAGFAVARRPGFGPKRHMTAGSLSA